MAFATGTLTASGVFANTETVTVGGKVYTMQTTLTNVDGNVLIGANAAASLTNLKAAINLDPAGAGTLYAAAMTANPGVVAGTLTATTLVVSAKIDGALGNVIPSTETGTNAAWGGSVLSGGSGDGIGDIITILRGARAGIRQRVLDKLVGDAG